MVLILRKPAWIRLGLVMETPAATFSNSHAAVITSTGAAFHRLIRVFGPMCKRKAATGAGGFSRGVSHDQPYLSTFVFFIQLVLGLLCRFCPEWFARLRGDGLASPLRCGAPRRAAARGVLRPAPLRGGRDAALGAGRETAARLRVYHVRP